MTNQNYSIPRFLWLWMPVIFIVVQIAIEIFVPADMKARIHSEWGPHETVQTFVIIAAFLASVFTLTKVNWKEQRLLGAWIVLAALCCFYVSGEEISWGQHVFRWATPEYWAGINDQQETNLHNTSSWLDQKPRILLFIGTIVGGLIIPALRKWKPQWLPERFKAIYPSNYLIVTALGVSIPYLMEVIWRHLITGQRLFTRESELQELYMYYFVLLYLIDIRYREFRKK